MDTGGWVSRDRGTEGSQEPGSWWDSGMFRLGKDCCKSEAHLVEKFFFSLSPMEPGTALSFTGQNGVVSVGPFSSLPNKKRGWCRRVIAILRRLQSLTSHLAKCEISCYLPKGGVEKGLNPEEEVWFPEQSPLSGQHVYLHVQGWQS